MSEAPPLAEAAAAVEAQRASGRLVDEAERVARQLSDSLPSITAPPGDNHADATAEQPARVDEPPPAATAADEEEATGGALAARAEALRARAGERVERLREVSVVVFDEAHDDPALRFVLVAAALFVVFLLILIFSHFLG
jgi:hypothetical protein